MFNTYKHLNEKTTEIPLSTEQLATLIVNLNYGTHRMVCALVEAHRLKYGGDSKLADALEEAATKYTY